MGKKQLFVLMGFVSLTLFSVVIPVPSASRHRLHRNPMVLNYDLFLPAVVKDVPIIEKFFKGLRKLPAAR
jgi:hypothetical protein